MGGEDSQQKSVRRDVSPPLESRAVMGSFMAKDFDLLDGEENVIHSAHERRPRSMTCDSDGRTNARKATSNHDEVGVERVGV